MSDETTTASDLGPGDWFRFADDVGHRVQLVTGPVEYLGQQGRPFVPVSAIGHDRSGAFINARVRGDRPIVVLEDSDQIMGALRAATGLRMPSPMEAA